MSLRRRLVVGMLVLLVAGLVTTDLLTSSSLRSFLLGRLDEQIDASQNQAYAYISQVYRRDISAGDRTPVTDPGTWLAELATKPTGGTSFTGHRPVAPHLNAAAFAARVSGDSYVEVLSSSGKVLIRVPSGLAGNPDPAPALPTASSRSNTSPRPTCSEGTTARMRPRAPPSTCPRRGRVAPTTGCTRWRYRAAPW